MNKRLLLLLVAMLTAMCAFAQNETRRFSERENRNEREMRNGIFFQSERENRNEQEARISPFSMRENAKPELRRNRKQTFTPAQANAIMHRLDSIVEVEIFEGDEWRGLNAFEYDKHGRPTLLEYRSWWNGDLEWASKTELAYDNIGNLIERIRWGMSWDGTRELVREWRGVFRYDSNRNLIERIQYEWDTAENAWQRHWRNEFIYDSNGNLIEEISSWWDSWQSEWSKSGRTVFTHDSNGNVIRAGGYTWSNEWIESWKLENTFDSNGNMLTERYYEWNWEDYDWRIRGRAYWVYDSHGNSTSEIHYSYQTVWDWEKEDYVEYVWRWEARYNNTYTNGNLTSRITQRHDGENWVNDERSIFAYDNQNRRIMVSAYDWDWDDSNTWVMFYRVEFEFDTNGNIRVMSMIERESGRLLGWRQILEYDSNVPFSAVIWPFGIYEDEGFQLFNKPVSATYYYFDFENDAWHRIDGGMQLFYSEVNQTDIPIIPASVISIFPNPASDYFTVSGLTENTLVTVSNLTGQIVLQQVVSPSESVSVNHLPAGIYIVNVNGQSQRLIVR